MLAEEGYPWNTNSPFSQIGRYLSVISLSPFSLLMTIYCNTSCSSLLPTYCYPTPQQSYVSHHSYQPRAFTQHSYQPRALMQCSYPSVPTQVCSCLQCLQLAACRRTGSTPLFSTTHPRGSVMGWEQDLRGGSSLPISQWYPSSLGKCIDTPPHPTSAPSSTPGTQQVDTGIALSSGIVQMIRFSLPQQLRWPDLPTAPSTTDSLVRIDSTSRQSRSMSWRHSSPRRSMSVVRSGNSWQRVWVCQNNK